MKTEGYKVNSKRDYKEAYEFIGFLEDWNKELKSESVKLYIINTKRNMRKYASTYSTDRIVKDYGIDGYIKLIQLPDFIQTLDEAKEYFDENLYIHHVPDLLYDCTGESFTSWFYVFKRRNKYYAYHSIGFDV